MIVHISTMVLGYFFGWFDPMPVESNFHDEIPVPCQFTSKPVFSRFWVKNGVPMHTPEKKGILITNYKLQTIRTGWAP
jgi:hypothetical protein